MMRPLNSIVVAVLLALAGCAAVPGLHDPARTNQAVSLVNMLSWTNAVSDKPDALRTAWPLAALTQHTEQFPLTQVKQCDAAGVCKWGVLKAQRMLSAPRYVAGGVAVDLALSIDVGRAGDALQGGETVALAIPADVQALEGKRTVRKPLVLPYGKVERIDLGFGIAYDLCAQRLNAAGQPVDSCDIPYL
ncbi:hypothetical protein [Massilia soli]|uniref:Lipoprotein n=1 Tax=Massilia soli TaxID=2792854 RepID=A0ABS7SRL0_9BURK|nr:hypothetical protein [Massilia soli]MBZ2208598.1 hypothetical protein [Massilia soli]